MEFQWDLKPTQVACGSCVSEDTFSAAEHKLLTMLLTTQMTLLGRAQTRKANTMLPKPSAGDTSTWLPTTCWKSYKSLLAASPSQAHRNLTLSTGTDLAGRL